MKELLERELVVVTGKGGVGKTTIAAAIGMMGARHGLRTIVVEVGDQQRLPALFGHQPREGGAETPLQERLSSISIDPNQALLEWVQELGGRVPGRVLASSGTFQYFAAAAPGAREMVSMVKIWELTRGKRWQRRARGYDLVVLDAPATGNALGLLGSPRTFGAIARVGPVAGQSQRVRELLEDPARTSYVAVSLATDMAVTETLELEQGLRDSLGRELSTVVVNALLPQRFSAADMDLIDGLRTDDPPTRAPAADRERTGGVSRAAGGARSGRSRPGSARGRAAGEGEVRAAALRAARTVHDRARFQHNQVARLRRRSFTVVGVPFAWTTTVDLRAIERISEQLSRERSGGAAS